MYELELVYRPKEQSISYMEVNREVGHLSNAIHMHDHDEIVLVTSTSSCRVINNGNEINLKTPAIFINRAGTFHEVVEVTEGNYDSKVVFFHPQVMSKIPSEILESSLLFEDDMLILPLLQEEVELFLPLFELLKARTIQQKFLLLLCILNQMEQIMNQDVQPIHIHAKQSYIFDIINKLRETDGGKYTVTYLAKQFHVSETKLKNDFKRITGIPIKTFKYHVRLQKAMVLLETTRMEQTQIAYICGFSDESYFIRAFRKVYGMTPREYRRKVLK